MGDNENFKWDEYNNPVAIEAQEQKLDDRIKRTLKKHLDLKDDEIATSFPDRASLRAAWEDYKKIKKVDTSKVENEEEEPEDDFDLPDNQRKEMQTRLDKRKAAKKKKEDLLVKQGEKMIEDASDTEQPEPPQKISKKKAKKIAPPSGEEVPYIPPKKLTDILGEDFDVDAV